MNAVTVEAESEVEAGEKCARVHGWIPDAIREVDSGWLDRRMWRCYESAQDAAVRDNQR